MFVLFEQTGQNKEIIEKFLVFIQKQRNYSRVVLAKSLQSNSLE